VVKKLLDRLGLGDVDRLALLHRRLGIATLVLPAILLAIIVAGVVRSAPPTPVPPPEGDRLFGLEEEERREIFTRITRHEHFSRSMAKEQFPGDSWSQSDAYFGHMRDLVVHLARIHDLHTSQIFLVFDEGIRLHWPDDRGNPLPATTVPLRPRTR
jgi:hypothetical protein